MIDFPYIVVCGPTASGKSKTALDLAAQFKGEIVSCDSVQFYRGFDIGSAKPSVDEQTAVKHHMIDILDWHEDFDACQYAKMARECLREIHARGQLPIVVGGSGLFLRALWGQDWHNDLPKDEELRTTLNLKSSTELYTVLKQCDPQRAEKLHTNDKFRVVRALELFYLTGKTFAELTSTVNREEISRVSL